MEAWLALLHFLSELISFLLIRAFETVKYWFHQGFRDGRQKVPPLRKAFLSYSATKLARMIRDKQLSSEELVNAVIERIREVNPILNALVEDRFEEALDDARRADQELATCQDLADLSRTKPFFGVPFTVKDSIGVKGMLAEVGSDARRGFRAPNDSVLVTRMVAAGGIPVAITNVVEMLFWLECSNHLHGRTNNPYDLHRTSGGSSGGEAALISSCASIWGAGSDITGSIRVPSAFCGLFGHKPSPGLIDPSGTYPENDVAIRRIINVLGPMTRSAEDCVAMMKVIADEPSKLRLDDPVDISALRFFFCDHEGTSYISSVQPEVRKQVHRVVDYLQNDFGVKAKTLPEAENMSRGQEWWFSFFEVNGHPPLQADFDQPENLRDPITELIKHIGGFSHRNICYVAVHILEAIYRKDKAKCQASYQELQQYKQRLYDLLRDDGVLILPSGSTVAPFHHGMLCNPLRYLGLAGLINVLRLPATVVPMGLDTRGIPLSVQIVAGHGHDRLTLAVARKLEEKFGGYVPPCKISN